MSHDHPHDEGMKRAGQSSPGFTGCLIVAAILLYCQRSTRGAEEPLLAAKEAVERLIEQRESIVNGMVRLRLEHTKLPSHKNDYKGVVRTYTVWTTPDDGAYRSMVEWAGPKASWKQHTLKSDAVGILFEPGEWSPTAELSEDVGESGQTAGVVNVPLLGLALEALTSLPSHTVRDELGALIASAERGEMEPDGDRYKLVCRRGELEVTYWLAPAYGWQPVQVVSAHPKGGRTVLKTQYKEYAVGGRAPGGVDSVWFPEQVSYTVVGEEGVLLSDLITTEDADFHRALPSSVFSIRSLGLSPGRRILGPGNLMYTIDRSGEMRRATSRDVINPDSENANYFSRGESIDKSTAEGNSYSVLLWANVVVVAVLTLAVLWGKVMR